MPHSPRRYRGGAHGPGELADPLDVSVPGAERVHIAVCDRDDCAWKHRGVTALATTEAAQAHSRSAGHSVSLYEDHEKVGGTMPWHPGSEEAEAERLSIEGRIRELERVVLILLGALHDPGRPVLTESQYRELYARIGAVHA